MVGVRGVRLGVLRPELYALQAQAVAEAVAIVCGQGGHPGPKILIPMVSTASELRAARALVTRRVERVLRVCECPWPIPIGCMIETPRAALCAAELAAHADFLAIGTNDLTQLTWAIDRDDGATAFLGAYLDRGWLAADPNTTLEAESLGTLVRSVVVAAKSEGRSVPVGVCGEHAADPASILLLDRLGVDYVSCAPPGLPTALLVAAQARLKGGKRG